LNAGVNRLRPATVLEERIGVLGGTFDPVHNGHLHIAEVLRHALDLGRIVWVPAGRPPHKQGQIVSSDEDRVQMLRLALAGSPADDVSLVDLERNGPSYTADTLEALSRHFDRARLFFLMGEDSLRDFPTWHDPDRILNLAELAVAGRPGVDTDLQKVASDLPALNGRVHLVSAEELPISSSDIRRRVRAKESIGGLVPPSVADYIGQHSLYTGTQLPLHVTK
jgi:nicotinate-nucleotide adenylyltransferase